MLTRGDNIDGYKVLFPHNENDYAVSLITKTKDKIFLYRTDKNDSLKNLYEKLSENSKNYLENREFSKLDTLKVPNIKFNKIRYFNELCNRPIIGTDLIFSTAIETLQFELNNKGGKVKSEAVAMIKLTSAAPNRNIKPRHFNFDKTFMYMIRDKATKTILFVGVVDSPNEWSGPTCQIER